MTNLQQIKDHLDTIIKCLTIISLILGILRALPIFNVNILPEDLICIITFLILLFALIIALSFGYVLAAWLIEWPLRKKAGTTAGIILILMSFMIIAVWPMPFTTISITSFREDSKVAYEEPVNGTAYHVPSDKYLWIIVYNIKSGRYYPQERPVFVTPMGNWSTVAYFGRNGTLNVGENYTVMVVLADKNVSENLTTYTNAYKGNERKPGLEALPNGIVYWDMITVTRKY